MARKEKINDYGTGIPYHEMEALTRVLLPEIQTFFESEEDSGSLPNGKHGKNMANRNRTNARGGSIHNDVPAYS